MKKAYLRKLVCLVLTVIVASFNFCANVNAEAEQNAGEVEPYILYTGNTWHNPGDIAVVRGEHLNLAREIQISRVGDNSLGKPGFTVGAHFDRLETEFEKENSFEISRLGVNKQNVAILQQTEKSLKFIIPESLKSGVYAVRIVYGGSSSVKEEYYYINTPEVKWVQGNEGATAAPGGWIRIQGSNLSVKGREDKVKVVLENTESGKRSKIKEVEVIDEYSVKASLPDDIKTGAYRVYLYNGYGNSTCWSSPVEINVDSSPQEKWPQDVFNIMDYGAVGDGTVRENTAFDAALKAAKANGGGIVYLPAGRYMLTNSFTIPSKTVILGESAEDVLVFWTPFDWNYGELPDYMLAGLGNFKIENITFSGARIGNVIVGGKNSPQYIVQQAMKKEVSGCENIYVNNCRFHFDSFGGYPTIEGKDISTLSNMINNELTQYKSQGIYIAADNVQVTDCELLTSGRTIVLDGNNLLVQNIKIPIGEWSGCYGDNIIMEKVESTITWGFAGSNIYSSGVSVENKIGNNRESMTFDGGSAKYLAGKLEEISDDGLTFKLEGANFAENKYVGWQLYIVGGTGEGQIRTIVANTKDTVTVSEQFLGEFDETTVATVGEERNSIYLKDWNIYNSGAVQLYGFGTNVVMDGISIKRGSGIAGRAGNVYGAYQVNWYNSFINNEISDSNYFKYYGFDLDNRYTNIKLTAGGKYTGTNIATLIKNNTLLDKAYISLGVSGAEGLNDTVICGNRIEGADIGIEVSGANFVRGMLLANNQYKGDGVLTNLSYSDDVGLKDATGALRCGVLSSKRDLVRESGWLRYTVTVLLALAAVICIVMMFRMKKSTVAE